MLYDGECDFCIRMARRLRRTLHARGYDLSPVQAPWVEHCSTLTREQWLQQIWLLFPDGSLLGGADAVIYLAGRVWWAWPLWLVGHLPLGRLVLRRRYRWIASHRACVGDRCRVSAHQSL